MHNFTHFTFPYLRELLLSCLEIVFLEFLEDFVDDEVMESVGELVLFLLTLSRALLLGGIK